MRSIGPSPNDPIFYMHHRNVDRIWAKWQAQNPNVALTYFGTPGPLGTPQITDMMNFHGLHPDVVVKDGIDHKSGAINGLMCFDYSNSVTPISVPSAPSVSTSTASVPAVQALHAQPQIQPRSGGAPTFLSFLQEDFKRVATSLGGSIHKRSIRSQPIAVTPDVNDRQNKVKLRPPVQIPKDALVEWMFSEERITQVRKQEEQIKKFTKFINTLPVTFQTSIDRTEAGRKYGWRPKNKDEAALEHKITMTLVDAFLAKNNG